MFARTASLAVALAATGCAAAPLAPSAISADGRQAWTQACSANDEWDKPGPPFRVYGNTWYMGTCGITAILVTGEQGHVLIDGGTAAGAPIIAANIEALGFRLSDVELLLHSHEHFDHVGGLAELQRRTGARLLASPQAAPVIASGIAAADDPQAGMHDPFDPAEVSATLTPAEPVTLGTLRLLPVATPGHTPGALSWQWESCEGGECRTIVYADSLSPISRDGYRFSDHSDLVAAFRSGLDRLASLDCDILLTPHPIASAMHQRLVAGALQEAAPCRAYAASITSRLDGRLAQEAADTP